MQTPVKCCIGIGESHTCDPTITLRRRCTLLWQRKKLRRRRLRKSLLSARRLRKSLLRRRRRLRKRSLLRKRRRLRKRSLLRKRRQLRKRSLLRRRRRLRKRSLLRRRRQPRKKPRRSSLLFSKDYFHMAAGIPAAFFVFQL